MDFPEEWREVEIFGRQCYVRLRDFQIFSCLSGSVTGETKTISEMPDNGFLITVQWVRVADQRNRHKTKATNHGHRRLVDKCFRMQQLPPAGRPEKTNEE